jgi:hypothetical protein
MKHIQNFVVDPQFDINPGGYVKSRTLTCIAALAALAALATPIQLAAQDQGEHHKNVLTTA